jgi:hypothetical protein
MPQVVAYPKKVARITHSKSVHAGHPNYLADGREQGGEHTENNNVG